MDEDTPVAVGIDAAVTAKHHIVVRRPQPGRTGQVVDDFVIPPTLGGLGQLTRRLAHHQAVLAAAEPTSMTWLSLAIALGQADVKLALVGARHVARLRGAVSGKNKSDVIDAQLLAGAGEVFDLTATTLPSSAELALQRACRCRGKLLVEANRCWRRLVALGRWAFPDVWNALGGSRAAIVAVLGRWPHLGSLARARLSSIAEEISRTTRGIADATGRARTVREAAAGWAAFWDGHLDLDALAWELLEMLDQLADLQGPRRPCRPAGHRLLGSAVGRRRGTAVGARHGSPRRAGRARLDG